MEYSDEILKQVQNRELDIVDRIEALSQKYNFTYWLEYGSAIGAVRHNGFIPWDDDMDIGMLREDYNIMRNIPQSEWGEMRVVDPLDANTNHIRLFSQCIIENTYFLTKEYDGFVWNGKPYKPNINVDIFVYDYCRDNKYTIVLKKAKMLKRLYMYSRVKVCPVSSMSVKKKIANMGKVVIYYLMKFFKITPEKIARNFVRLMAENEGASKVANFTTVPISETNASFRNVKEYLPVKYVNFEGREYPIPKCYDSLLIEIYGNYMSLPPEEDRHRHVPIEMDLGNDIAGRFITNEYSR